MRHEINTDVKIPGFILNDHRVNAAERIVSVN